jgi:hypothetical protein
VTAWPGVVEEPSTSASARLLEAIFCLLRLKPLIDADLGVPPIVVFPSVDRLLSQHEPVTRGKLTRFVGETLGSLLNLPLTSIENAVGFAKDNPKEFLQSVENQCLLIGERSRR